MAGWIKINRKIIEHWLWQDAERLKWWLDLLFMASWEERKTTHDAHLITLQRGADGRIYRVLKRPLGKEPSNHLEVSQNPRNRGNDYKKSIV